MTEKRISAEMLESARLTLSPGEVSSADLPEHSASIDVVFQGEPISAQWSSASRQIHGDAFGERLQDFGQVGGLVRLRRNGPVWELTVVPPQSVRFRPGTPLPISAPPVAPRRNKPKRRKSQDRKFHADREFAWSDDRLVGFLTEARTRLVSNMRNGGFDPRQLVVLRMEGERLAIIDGYEELFAVDVANVDHMRHQEAVARQVLSKMRGRAVLADEVGLGKTIEAGLIAKELALRGIAKRFLIICPATLREQWKNEMDEKFELDFEVALSSPDVRNQDRLILSPQLAMKNLDTLAKKAWDVVIYDEAHRAAGSGATKTREMIASLTRPARYVMLLTATPVQNDLLELYRLVEILRPGTLGSERQFRDRFVDRDDPRNPVEPADLRRLVSSAMVRTTRAQAGVDRVKRRTTDIPVKLSKPEAELYVLATDLLRNVMTDRSDGLRRRVLAHRLSTSPYSMGTTALRMASQHPDRRVASVLEEIGHKAMDLPTNSREEAAITIARDWLKAHGRVLLFTQHADTITPLLNRFASEGIAAAAFHGGLNAAARSAAIAEFKRGDAKVLLSTDAGAEGQNLQFCNCVINYDLPWNPMRIEQRIGRVDRLTQPRDEVFVANLFAVGTIDEHVYRLLHDKLRMFELLFGQVTTILGELDGSKDLTFEGRVMEALFAKDDSGMKNILAQLGADLESARRKGEEMVGADTGLSAWLVTAKDHRSQIDSAGAKELAPDLAGEKRTRRTAVQTWTRGAIDRLGGKIIHDRREDDLGFVSAELPDELADELGGRSVVHLAFDRNGLAEHPDAELCAAGSPAFTDLLSLLRERGDLHFSVTDLSAFEDIEPTAHDDAIELVETVVVPAPRFSGTATYRLEVGDVELSERIIEAEVNAPKLDETPKRTLDAGERLHPTIDIEHVVMQTFDSAATVLATSARAEFEELARAASADESERVQIRYDAMLGDTPWNRSSIESARQKELERLMRVPTMRARLEILAMDVVQHGVRIEEVWRHVKSGATASTYRGATGPVLLGASTAKNLSMCSEGHLVESSGRHRCAACGDDACDKCGPNGAFARCSLCGGEACGRCRSRASGLCALCAEPTRVSELDESHAVAWRAGSGTLLMVGQGWCEVRGSGLPALLVPDDDTSDLRRRAARRRAVALGLPADSGLALETVGDQARNDPSMFSLDRDIRYDTVWVVIEGGGCEVTESMDIVNDPAPEVVAMGETSMGAVALLTRLRSVAPPPAPPLIISRRKAFVTEIGLDAVGLFRRSLEPDEAGEPVEVDRTVAEWIQASPENAERSGVVATAAVGEVAASIVAVNSTFRIDVTVGHRSVQVTGAESARELREEESWKAWLVEANTPGGRLLIVDREPLTDDDFLHPSRPRLIDRSVENWWEALPSEGELPSSARPPASEDLLPTSTEMVEAQSRVQPLPRLLANQLSALLSRPATHLLTPTAHCHETWFDRGTVSLEYDTRRGEIVDIELDDSGEKATDFRVCSRGHVHALGAEPQCAVCKEFLCGACDPTGPLHRCVCERDACRRCSTTRHEFVVATCVDCGQADCTRCGARVYSVPCESCGRDVCGECASDGRRCTACASMRVADAKELAALPSAFALAGASVLLGVHRGVTVLALRAAQRDEFAMVVDGEIVSWVSFAEQEDISVTRCRLALSERFGWPVTLTRTSGRTMTDPHNVIPISDDRIAVVGVRLAGEPWEILAERVSPNPVDGPLELAKTLKADVRAVPIHSLMARPAGLAEPNLVAGVEVEYGTVERRTLVGCSPNGLVRYEVLGDAHSSKSTNWHLLNESETLESKDWSPPARVVAVASMDDYGASVVHHGQRVAVRTVMPGRVRWFEVSTGAFAMQSAVLQQRMGLAQPISGIDKWTVPAEIVFPVVRGASMVERTVSPVASASNAGSVVAIAGRYSEWDAELPGAVPEFQRLSHDAAAAFAAVFRPPASGCISIGARVTERWLTMSGVSTTIAYDLAPGQQEGAICDHETGRLVHSVGLDDEGHAVESPRQCPYCQVLSCGKCANPVVSCSCCGINVCRRCASSDRLGLCEACRSMTEPKRLELIRQGKWTRPEQIVRGKDGNHSVELVLAGGVWTATVQWSLGKSSTKPVDAVLAQQIVSGAR